MRKRTLPVWLLTIATALLLTACGTCSPTIQTETIRLSPPAALLADCPPPDIPDPVETRDQMRTLTLDLAEWGATCRGRVAALRVWAAD